MRFLAALYSFFLLWAIFIEATEASPKGTRVSCKDEDGQNVDWFYMYKLPKHYETNNAITDASGLKYVYITSRNFESWQSSRFGVNEDESMPAQTLKPIFDDPTTVLVAYNDEFPNGTVVMSHGHTKGVVAADGETGIWLIHSVPKYPSIPKYEYPTTGQLYGQSFLCLTLMDSEVQKIGEQLTFNEPNIYFKRIPVMLSGKYPHLEQAINQEWHKDPPFHNVAELSTLDGRKFRSFAKSSKFNQDLYEDLLAPSLDVNLMVEAWRNGHGNLPSNCTKSDKVYNVAEIDMKLQGIKFKTTSDHSKWAVSQATGLKVWRWRVGGADWVCIGDINRQEHQLVRGGGTVCQKSSRVARLYRSIVADYEPCERNVDSAPIQP